MQLLLLPGFDGTGELFAPLQAAITQRFDVKLARYEDEDSLDQYVTRVASFLPERDAVLVAESFSGPIALALLARNPSRFRCAVLCATFATSPYRALTGLAQYLPSSMLSANWATRFALRRGCLDRTATPSLLLATDAVLRSLPAHRIKSRMRLLAQVDVRALLPHVTVPILYLQAASDKTVGARLSRELTDRLPQVEVQCIDGPHFLLQSRPGECARSIEVFLEKHLLTQ